MKRKTRPIPITILLFLAALILRIPGLNRPFIFDEARALGHILGPFSSIVSKVMGDFHPPFYYFLLKYWTMISFDPLFMRIPTVILGSLTCVILYKTVKEVFTQQAAYYAFAFAALSPQMIFQSQYIRPYCLATFLTVLLVYLFIRFIKAEKPGVLYYFAVFSVLTALSIFTFYMSFLIILAINISAIYILRTDREKLVLWIASQVAAGLAYSSWLPFFFSQKNLIATDTIYHVRQIENAGIGFYIGKIHVGNIVRTVMAYIHLDDVLGQAGRYSECIRSKWALISVIMITALSVALCALRACREMLKSERVKGASLLLLMVIAVPAVSVITLSVGGDLGLWSRTAVTMRYFSQSSIYMLALFSIFLISLKREYLRKGIIFCAAVSFLFIDLNIYRFPANIYNGAVNYLCDKNRDCNLIILAPSNALGFFNTLSDKRFSDYRILEYNDNKPDTEDVARRVEGADKFYFYYFKSAENMVLFPGLDAKFEKLARGIGFEKKDENRINDVITISYYERKK